MRRKISAKICNLRNCQLSNQPQYFGGVPAMSHKYFDHTYIGQNVDFYMIFYMGPCMLLLVLPILSIISRGVAQLWSFYKAQSKTNKGTHPMKKIK